MNLTFHSVGVILRRAEQASSLKDKIEKSYETNIAGLFVPCYNNNGL